MIIYYIRNIFSYFFISIGTVFFIPLLLLCALVPQAYRHNRFLYLLLAGAYRVVIYALFMPISITGKEYMIGRPMVIVANHQSSLDIPLLGMLVGKHPHIWLVLAYYAHVPVLGFLIRRLFIPVDRSSPASASKALLKIIRLTKKTGAHTLIFPEGGRYNDGQIHNFSAGFAITAQALKQPVLPVFFSTAGKILPPGKKLANYFPIKVIIGEPFEYKTEETETEFVSRVYSWFVEQNNKHNNQ